MRYVRLVLRLVDTGMKLFATGVVVVLLFDLGEVPERIYQALLLFFVGGIWAMLFLKRLEDNP